MTFIDLEDGYPEKIGVYRVVVASVSQTSYVAKAKWNGEGSFQLIDDILDDEAFIISWCGGAISL